MTCKHDWHFIAEDALLCRRCGTQTGPRTPEQRTEDLLQNDTMPLFDDWGVDWNNTKENPNETR